MKIDSSSKLVCAGTGLVALDVVMNGSGKARYVHTGGSCANVMSILGFLGWSPNIVARLGKDPAGLAIKKELKRLGISVKSPMGARNDAPTPIIVQKNSTSRGVIKHSFSRRCPICGTWFPSFSPVPRIDALDLISKLPDDLRVFYFDRVSAGILELVNAAKARNALIVFEPSSKIEDHHFAAALELSDIVKYSAERHPSIPKSGNPKLEVKTFGGSGLTFRIQGKWTKLAAYTVIDVVDQAGAGDWCTAGIIHALANAKRDSLWARKTVENALEFGQALGALSCLHEGARGLMYQCDVTSVLADAREIQKNNKLAKEKAIPKYQPVTTLEHLCPGCSEE